MRVARQRRQQATSPSIRRADATPVRAPLAGFGLALLCAKVTLVPLVFDPTLDMPFVVSKAVISYGIACLLGAVLLSSALRDGRRFLRSSPIHVPVLAYLVVSGLASALAMDRALAVYGTHARMLGFLSVLDFVVLYIAVVHLVHTRTEWLVVAGCALAASVFVLAYELVQRLGLDPFRWSVDTVERPFSTIGQATTLAEYLTVMSLGGFAAALLVQRLTLLARLLLMAYSLVLIVGAAGTGTRSVLIGLGTGAGVLVAAVLLTHRTGRARVATAGGALCAFALAGGLVIFTPLGGRLFTPVEFAPTKEIQSETELAPSEAARVEFYSIGVEMVRERPLLGYGPDNFVVGVPRHRPEPASWYVRQSLATSAHGWIMQVATSSGVVGLAVYLAIVFTAAAVAFRSGRARPLVSLVVLAAYLGVGITTVDELGTSWLFWAALGAVASSGAAPLPERPARSSRTPRTAFRRPRHFIGEWPTVLLMVVALLLAFNGTAALDASRASRASQESRLDGLSAQAIDFGVRATNLDPRRAQYWHTLALACISGSRWSEAALALGMASHLAPYDVRYIGDAARVEIVRLQAGDERARSRALGLGARAATMDPRNPQAHHTLAIVLQVTNNIPDAISAIERALALDPGSTNEGLYLTGTQIMLSAHRTADAIRIARDGLGILGHAPRTRAIIVELARALWANGQAAEALSELDIAIGIDPADSAARQLRAQIQAAPGRPSN